MKIDNLTDFNKKRHLDNESMYSLTLYSINLLKYIKSPNLYKK